MPDMIVVDRKPYHHHSAMMPPDGADSPLRTESLSRQSFFRKRRKLPLDNTAGAYVPLGRKNLLLVIDKNSVAFGSPEWKLIAETAAHLEKCYPSLSQQGKTALFHLRAVIFSSRPLRSYADVEPDLFFYDTDELRRSDGSMNGPAWTASCIVHDANHIWQHDTGGEWTGTAAESECWKLQVDNCTALGLSPGEVAHLNGFIANPAQIIPRANGRTF